MKYDPYNFFDMLITEEGIATSSPKITPFSKIPKERQKMVLPELVYRRPYEVLNKYYNRLRTYQHANDILDFIPVNSDYVVYEYEPEKGISRAAEICLCEPNGWSAYATIGKDFEQIHSHVKNSHGGLIFPKPDRFLKMIMNLEEPYERIGALSLRESVKLDRHPDDFVRENFTSEKLFIRGERQGIKVFPEYNLFLFTIQTWFVDLTEKEKAKVFLQASEKNFSDTYFGINFDKKRKTRIFDILKEVSK